MRLIDADMRKGETMSLIDREALYEKACGLEAQALSYVGKIANDETKIEEWRIWSAILAERTAFKHDIFDAPEVKSEPHWIPCSDRLPEDKTAYYLVTLGNFGDFYVYHEEIDIARWDYDRRKGKDSWHWCKERTVTAWMPLPLAYRKEGA